ncbi:MAG: hypothetical protein P4L93_11735 [Coriobacteriia bacterium]|nr:hypothetical protein [Coriobacteriia bacterium]
MPKVSYYLTEAFCREHGHKGGTILSREFPEVGIPGWQGRRLKMQKAWPSLVPTLDRAGNPCVTDAPESVPGEHSRDGRTPDTFENVDERRDDGSRTRTRLLRLTADDLDSDESLLRAHGFNPENWTLDRVVNKAWNMASKNAEGTGHDISELYASTVWVSPKEIVLTVEDLAGALANVKPIRLKQPKDGQLLLELGIVDAHFGNSTLAWYRDSLARIIGKIRSRTWARIVIPVGSDFFHVDNFKNTTSNGTQQSSVDWTQASSDGTTFICAIIEAALESAAEVFVYYEIGNHDESMTWMFCQGLAWKYPQAVFDLTICERKVHRFGDVAIGITHGDSRNRKDLDRVFSSEFPNFASAKVREVHAAHYHHEISVDQFGVVTRCLSTAARTDKWHREEGFVGAMKRFMLFTFDPGALVSIDYV